ncbi:MAG: response regulator [Lachnospiraceae bacterium]|nr:response regulator [Lachnospiraceae bacterium]
MSDKQDGARVLIVDDVPINCMILSSLLASEGISSDIAGGGQECLDLCEKNEYDLILLDHRMPEIDGVDTFIKLKESFRKKGREAPVVCHTTEDAKKNINLYKAAGFADVLIKPIGLKEISKIITTYLPHMQQEAESSENLHRKALEKQIALLPEWLRKVEGIDPYSGLEYCEMADDYLETIQVFAASVQQKAAEIEKFYQSSNFSMYALRVHSLKSTSRLIGAKKLSDMSAGLEYAAKQGELDTLRALTPSLLEEYRKLGKALSPLLSRQEAFESSEKKALPEAPEETLWDAYASIQDLATLYDAENIRMILDSLNGFHLQEADQNKLASIRNALAKADWETIRETIS